MSRRLERLLKLDFILRSCRGIGIDRLADELEVSQRTVFYDLAFLRDRYCAPIAVNNGVYYYEDPTWRMPDSELTQEQILSLFLASELFQGRSYAG